MSVVSNNLYITDWNIFTQQKKHKLITARQSEIEVLSQEEPISPVVTASEALEEDIWALREENKRIRDQQSVRSSAAIADLENQIKALKKEITTLCKMAIKGNYIFGLERDYFRIFKSLSFYFGVILKATIKG